MKTKEEINEYLKEWRKANPDYSKEYRWENKEKIRAKQRERQRSEEYKAQVREYHKLPEVKARLKAYRQSDKRKAYYKAYRQIPEVKIKLRRKEERRRKRKEAENREFVINFKKDKCCSSCGYKEHTEILQFHHTGEKTKNISRMNGISLNRIKSEIDKCILLCPNCHLLLHSKKNLSKIL